MLLNQKLVRLTIVILACAACEPRVPDDRPGLMSAMAENDMSIHVAAMRKVIQRYGGPGLRKALASPNERTRARAAHGLASCPGVENEGALVGAASDRDEYVRIWAAYSLGQIGSARGSETLDRLQRDDSAGVRDSAARAKAVLDARLRGEPEQQVEVGLAGRVLSRYINWRSPVCAHE
jgi:HEAT repeat protein